MSLVADMTFIALLTLAALSDIESRKVSNALNFTLLLSGLGLSIIGCVVPSLSSVGPLQSLAGVGVSLAVLIFPFAWQIYQGGDVKLCMGMGAWLGVNGILHAIGLGVVAGGVIGLGIVIARRLRNMSPQSRTEEDLTHAREPFTIPMAVCFAGAGAWVYFELTLPW